jgi:PAP_fibrillin
MDTISPLENQSYSNNPDGGGRSNPFLPRRIQDRLERLGILKAISETRSSQSVDLTKQRVRNVVAFEIPSLRRQSRKASLTVDISFQANKKDKRKVDVKFDEVRLVIPNSRLNIQLPLGPVGPIGWLRTGYIDDNMRITRGHKGSVFILTRPAIKRRAEV